MRLFVTLFTITLMQLFVSAQDPTVGLLYHDETKAFDGFTMFLGGQRNVYLVDNCGNLINKWENTLPAGATVYLLPNGNLMRAVRRGQTTFQGGGIGGAVEMLDWNNNVLWQFDYHENNSHHQHHDIEPLPNGNVLILAWEHRTGEEAIAKGRAFNKAVWPTQIVEVFPAGANDGKIVWSWHLWDHTIQEVSDSLPDYGIISEHPELLDINLGGEGVFPGAVRGLDWLHCNSVEYIEEFDWILISSKHMHEIYIIDHSTTTEEAAGHTGGKYGKGGDFLYRWGNPQNYRRGTVAEKALAGQHDAIWIPGDETKPPQIMLVNNGKDGRVDVLTPPLTADGKFAISDGEPFGPLSLSWSHEAEIQANIGCSARRLNNGNTVYCDAQTGLMEEVTFDKELVWQYQNPVRATGPVEQGTDTNSGSFGGGFGSFRAEKYSRDYITDTLLDLSPKGKVELNPYQDDCVIDVTAPIIALLGDSLIVITEEAQCGDDGVFDANDDMGVSAFDDMDGDITTLVKAVYNDGEAIDCTCNSVAENKGYTITYTVSDAAGNEVATERLVNIEFMEFCVGIEDNPIGQFVDVFPNPTNGKLIIQSTTLHIAEILVYDVVGKTILTIPPSELDKIHQLDLSNQTAGMYLLKLVTNKGTITRKIQLF